MVRVFELPSRPRAAWWGSSGCVAAMVVFPAIALFPSAPLVMLAALAAGGLAGARVVRRRIWVGADGVRIDLGLRHSFLPYRAIEAVCHLPPRRGALGAEGWWRVELGLRSGEGLALETAPGSFGSDELGERIVGVLYEARAAAAGESALVGEEVALVRGRRSSRAWIAGLRRLGERTTVGYRKAVIRDERLEAICLDPALPLPIRAAAAVALDAAGHDAGALLREAAATLACDAHRRALLSVADAHDDAALAQALFTLDAQAAS